MQLLGNLGEWLRAGRVGLCRRQHQRWPPEPSRELQHRSLRLLPGDHTVIYVLLQILAKGNFRGLGLLILALNEVVPP